MAWNQEKQVQFDKLQEQYKEFITKEYPALLDWFTLACGDKFDEHMLSCMINNATEIIEKLKPFSRNSTK